MIRLGPPGERGQQVVLDGANVEFDHPAAVARREQRHELVVRQADFLPGVEIEIVRRGFDPRFATAGGLFQQRVGGNEMFVNRVPQMRQIQPAECPVPVRAVALAR